jgi:hypothetical protein
MSVCLANTDGRRIHQIASVRDERGLGAGATMWLVRRR